jgi:hypothetical protein
MLALLHTIALVIANLFKSRRRLEAENVLLRLQLNIALRRAPARLRLRGSIARCWWGWSGSGLILVTLSRW